MPKEANELTKSAELDWLPVDKSAVLDEAILEKSAEPGEVDIPEELAVEIEPVGEAPVFAKPVTRLFDGSDPDVKLFWLPVKVLPELLGGLGPPGKTEEVPEIEEVPAEAPPGPVGGRGLFEETEEAPGMRDISELEEPAEAGDEPVEVGDEIIEPEELSELDGELSALDGLGGA